MRFGVLTTMIKILTFGLSLMVLVMTVGCSVSSEHDDSSAAHGVVKKLQQQYAHWKGTPYALGGLSHKGIDCSGFVYLTFLNQLGISLPRTTEYLAKTGSSVPLHDIQPGDLVFFKTSYFDRHVGIYLGDNQFIHASSSKGVMISHLTDNYWQRHYWQTRRIGFSLE